VVSSLLHQMNKENILFIIHTEYHLLVALSIIADNFNDSTKFGVQIYQTETKGKRRFQFEKKVNNLPLSYYVLKYDEADPGFNPNLRFELAELCNQQWHRLFICNHHGFLDIYLSWRLAKQGALISLAPDGTKPYGTTRMFTPRWSVLATLRFYTFLFLNRIWIPKLHILTLTYANLNEINEVWVHFPESFNNRTNKIVRYVNVLKSPISRNFALDYFDIDVGKFLPRKNKIIFYANQPVKDRAIHDFEISLLENLVHKFPNYLLVIKLHPITNEHQVLKFEHLKNVSIIKQSFPAELFISCLSDSMVVSFDSTASLVNNEQCRFYWIHPMLIKENLELDYLTSLNPTSFIKEVSSIEEIQ